MTNEDNINLPGYMWLRKNVHKKAWGGFGGVGVLVANCFRIKEFRMMLCGENRRK